MYSDSEVETPNTRLAEFHSHGTVHQTLKHRWGQENHHLSLKEVNQALICFVLLTTLWDRKILGILFLSPLYMCSRIGIIQPELLEKSP